MLGVRQTFAQSQRNECEIGGCVSLTPTESRLLGILLVSHPVYHVSEAELIDLLWPNPDAAPDAEAVCLQTNLQHLRKAGVPIANRHGFGWRIPEWRRL